MKRILSAMLALVVASAVAGVMEPFKQFTQADYVDAPKPGQGWWASNTFTLKVQANTSVYLSNYVRSWYEPIADLNGNVYNMNPMQYGYINKDDMPNLTMENGSYDDLIHWSNGKTTTITYTYDENPSITNSTTGYLLDSFTEDAEIYLVMTTIPTDGGETVDTYQYVQDANNDTTMVSRQHNTLDLANNVRVNFGIDSASLGLIGREFVAVYTGAGDSSIQATGQPLPGLLYVGLLSFGTLFGSSKLKKRS